MSDERSERFGHLVRRHRWRCTDGVGVGGWAISVLGVEYRLDLHVSLELYAPFGRGGTRHQTVAGLMCR